jgi:hypothetical protein
VNGLGERTIGWLAAMAVLCGAGCARAWTNGLLLPADNTLVRGQLVIHSDAPMASHHRLIEELIVRRQDLEERLRIPVSDEPIHVYLFEDAERFQKYLRLHHPLFPARRAFFLETDTRLSIYAQWGDRVAEDLRHEVTHGYLHSVVPRLPIWIDEGIAEYFEVPRGSRGFNRPHVDLLIDRHRKGQWTPDLKRLEGLDPNGDMTQEQYAESWAWVHMLLETPLERELILPRYLDDLRREGASTSISARLRQHVPDPESMLVAHVGELARAVELANRRRGEDPHLLGVSGD